MEGYLYKWTNYITGWKLRYFVLKNNILFYYELKGEKPRGKIHMSVSKVSEDPLNDLKLEIETGTSIIYLKCHTTSEKSIWLESLKKSNLKIEGILKNENENENENENSFEYQLQNEEKVEKLHKKLNKVGKFAEKMQIYNQMYIKLVEKYKENLTQECISEIVNLNSKMNNDVVKMKNSLQDMKFLYDKFHGEFLRLAEFFSENDTFKSNTLKEKSAFIKSSEELNSSFRKNHVANAIETIQEKEEIFFGALEESSSPRDNFKDDSIQKDKEQIIKLKIEEPKAQSMYYDCCYEKRRNEMPTTRKTLTFNIWSVLKDAVGKDLSKFCVPVYFNEPLSLLQRLCENFQYGEILNRAGTEEISSKRLALVAAYALGGFSMNVLRTLKPFNPLLGETYEYIDEELGFKYFAEQVSHHPPISSCYAESELYIYYTNSNAKSNFSLSKGALEFHPTGRTYLIFKKFKETISFTKPKACVRGLLTGNLRLDCYGKVIINNHFTDEFCELEFFEEGIFSSKDKGKILGAVYDRNRNIQIKLEGNWLTSLDAIYPDSMGDFNIRETIWKKIPIQGIEEEKFFFTDFSINLNNLNDKMKEFLPHTDCRFRPDMRALEIQNIELASSEKNRLEEKQRSKRKEMEKNHIVYKPVYFEETYDELNGELIYKYCKDYWKDRETKNFANLSDIY